MARAFVVRDKGRLCVVRDKEHGAWSLQSNSGLWGGTGPVLVMRAAIAQMVQYASRVRREASVWTEEVRCEG